MNTETALALCAAALLTGSAMAEPPAPAAGDWQTPDDYSRAQLFDEHFAMAISSASTDPMTKALDGPFVFPDNADKDGGKSRLNSIFGIDISHWSSLDPKCKAGLDPSKEIDFSSLGGQLIRFVYVKATQDVGYRDCRFAEYWNALGELSGSSRPLRGAYHFLTATTPGSDQALSYLRFRNEQGGFDKGELPSVLDLEWDKTSTNPDRWVGKNNDLIVASALAWLGAVEKASGKKPIIYTCNAWLKEHKFTPAQLAKLKPYQLWIADYSTSRRAIEQPAQPKDFSFVLWQFTAGSRLSLGSSKLLDASIFKGSDDDFARAMQVTVK